MFKNFFRDKFNIFLLTNTISIIGFIILLIITLYFVVIYLPFPERFNIEEMTNEMIEMGQNKSLIMIYSFIALTILFFISLIITNIGLLYNLFGKNDLRFSLKKAYCKREEILYNIFYVVFIIAYNIINFILVWYLWLLYFKNNSKKNVNINFLLYRIKLKDSLNIKRKKIFYLFFSIFTPVVILVSFLVVALTSNKNLYNNLIPNQNVKKYLTLSNNKHNVIFLYFDRTQGVLWNFLLKIDQMINKENSFMSLFPEFCSYTNVVSTSSLTKISTPSIYGGSLFNVAMKQSNSKNINIQRTNNLMLTENEWYLYSLYNLSSMLKKHDINNISFDNLPYYGDQLISSYFGNMSKLQKDLVSLNMDVNVVTNAKIANYLFKKEISLFETETIFDGFVFDKMPSIIEFSPSNSGTYFSYFSQATHEPYVVKENNELKIINKPEYFINSIWLVIQQLKPFLLKLKNEPFVNEKNEPIFDKNNNPISVYDKSLIFIVSDHGYDVKKINKFNEILSFLQQNKVLNNNQVNVVNNFNHHQYIPILNIKKFKYNTDNEQICTNHKFTFNNDQVLSLQDIPIIIENYLNEYHKTKIPSLFYNHEILNRFDGTFKEVLAKQTLSNPLDSTNNSLKSRRISNRRFSIISTKDWRVHFNSTTFEPAFLYEWNMEYTNSTFYDNRNLKRIKSY